MTTRGKTIISRIDIEIEKCREERNWLKIIELAELRKKDKNIDNQYLSNLLIGEGKLEQHLESFQPVEANVNRAKQELKDAKSYLLLAANEMTNRIDAALDAHLLLGKLMYACGEYTEALMHFDAADLMHLSEKSLPLHSLRILAESYAVRGLCLRKLIEIDIEPKYSDEEADMIKCFGKAADLSLLYMQGLEVAHITTGSSVGSHSPLPLVTQKELGLLMEQALQEAPLQLLHANNLSGTLERYRKTFMAVEVSAVHSIRLRQMCQMAKLLLQGILNTVYSPPQHSTAKQSEFKPKVYKQINQFIPESAIEEAILVLLIAESIAARSIVLSQSPEFKDDRIAAYNDAKTVYDLLALATVRWNQISLLQESLERSMKFSFNEPHLWKQHALSLYANGYYMRSLLVLKEVIRLEPVNSSNSLMAARLCYEHLNLLEEGIEFSTNAKTIENEYPNGLLGRCHLFIGIGHYLKSNYCHLKKLKFELQQTAVEHLKSAIDLEPLDHLAHYYLGLNLAVMGRISEAEQYCRLALDLRVDFVPTLHFYVLLLTAKQEHDLALSVLHDALDEFPQSLTLMYVKAKLEAYKGQFQKALTTAKQILEFWKVLYEDQLTYEAPECDRRSDGRSTWPGYLHEMSEKGSSIFPINNNGVYPKPEQAFSEVNSSLSGHSRKSGFQYAWKLQLDIWMFLAEVYLELHQYLEVQHCIQEASLIFPQNYQIMHMKGLLHASRQEWKEAEVWFKNSISMCSNFDKSLKELGLVYYNLELYEQAESTFREAVKVNPKDHNNWFCLGKSLESLNEFEQASNAIANALYEEKHNPIVPFNEILISFD